MEDKGEDKDKIADKMRWDEMRWDETRQDKTRKDKTRTKTTLASGLEYNNTPE